MDHVSKNHNADIVVIGSGGGLAAAVTAAEAGADVIFVEAPKTMDELEKIPQLIKGPLLINIAPKTPTLHYKRYEEMGYRIAIYPPIAITASYAAIKNKLMELKEQGIVEQGAHGGVPFDELLDFLGIEKYRALEEKVFE